MIASIPPGLQAVVLLSFSNIFMTFAWYAHLKNLSGKPWVIAALASAGIALFEYLLQVPANRIGYTVMGLPPLKILQEVITLSVFVPFAMFYCSNPSGSTICGRGCAFWARCISFFDPDTMQRFQEL